MAQGKGAGFKTRTHICLILFPKCAMDGPLSPHSGQLPLGMMLALRPSSISLKKLGYGWLVFLAGTR